MFFGWKAVLQAPTRRFLALLLAVSLTFGMTGGFAFATNEGADGSPTVTLNEPATEPESETVADTPTDKTEPEISTDKVTPDSEQDEPPDTEEPDTVPSPEDGVNTTVCTCQPVESGEMVHSEDCPLYTAPEKTPAEPEALTAIADTGKVTGGNSSSGNGSGGDGAKSTSGNITVQSGGSATGGAGGNGGTGDSVIITDVPLTGK